MKDPLVDFIEENRERLDTYVPAEDGWKKLENRLKKHQSKKQFYKYAVAYAAILILSVILVRSVTGNEEETGIQIEADSGFRVPEHAAEKSMKALEHLSWSGQQPVDYYGAPSKVTSFSYSNTSSLNYLWSVQDVNAPAYTIVASGSNMNAGFINPYIPNQYGNVCVQEEIPYYGIGHFYEQYDAFEENKPESPFETPLSTFGIDVDGASYSNVRRFIRSNYLPPRDAVKLEEMINYFDYDFPQPEGDDPFSITTELAECPWDKDNLVLQVALQGKEIDFAESQSSNLVFLIDVSGSMSDADKLPLLKSSLNLLVEQMTTKDHVAIVVYAGASGLVLPSTSGENKTAIYDAINKLESGGSTAGGEGIELAYEVAQESFIKGGNNRVILATDGDFNVGITDDFQLTRLIEEKRKTGVFLSVLGFGTGNLQNSKMEKLADNGNGNYFYIDNITEAKKVLVNEIGGTLLTIAKDVKLQVEFNPAIVQSYRLLGYENRLLQPREFDDDTKDAGDLGSGHNVIALYEIVPQKTDKKFAPSTDLRYQKRSAVVNTSFEEELAVIRFRYKDPDSETSKLLERIVKNSKQYTPSADFLFATAVAEFGMLLRESKYLGDGSFKNVLERAKNNVGEDEFGYRAEFILLVERAEKLMEEYRKSAAHYIP